MPAGRSLQDAVAEATCKAVERIVPGTSLSVSATVVDSGPEGDKVVTVVGSCQDADGTRAMSGSSKVNRNLYRAVSEAVVSAYLASKQ